jgi:hypothetical protein
MTQLAKQVEALKSKGIILIAAQASEIDPKILEEWVKKNNIPYSVMIEGDVKKTKFIWGIQSLPWLILTDTDHLIKAEGFAVNELGDKIKAEK